MKIKAKCYYNDINHLWSISFKTYTNNKYCSCCSTQNYTMQSSFPTFENGWVSLQKDFLDFIYKIEKKRYYIQWENENDANQKLFSFVKKGCLVEILQINE